VTETAQAQNQYKEDLNPDSLHFEFLAQLHMFTGKQGTISQTLISPITLNKIDFAH